MSILQTVEHDQRKAVVRRMMMMNPHISVMALKERMHNLPTPIIIERHLLGDIVREIKADRIREINEETKEDLYARVAETVTFVNEQLRAIAQEERLVYTKKDKDGKPGEKAESRIFAQNNRIKAMNSVVDNLIKLVNLKMDLGIIERNLGTAEVRTWDMMEVLEKIRNGDYSTPLPELLTKRNVAIRSEATGADDLGSSVEA